jgi:hypothetical protein
VLLAGMLQALPSSQLLQLSDQVQGLVDRLAGTDSKVRGRHSAAVPAAKAPSP